MYVCTCVSMYLCMYVSMYVCLYVCMSVCMYVCLSVCKSVGCLSVWLSGCLAVCLSVCMHACMYVCLYIEIQPLSKNSKPKELHGHFPGAALRQQRCQRHHAATQLRSVAKTRQAFGGLRQLPRHPTSGTSVNSQRNRILHGKMMRNDGNEAGRHGLDALI